MTSDGDGDEASPGAMYCIDGPVSKPVNASKTERRRCNRDRLSTLSNAHNSDANTQHEQ